MHHCLQCLTQLASLSGVVLQNDETKVVYLSRFLQGFLHLIGRYDMIVTVNSARYTLTVHYFIAKSQIIAKCEILISAQSLQDISTF